MKRFALFPLMCLLLAACSTTPPQDIPARLTMVTLAVHDLKIMSDFYDKLQWPRSSRSNANYVAYQTGGAILSLWPKTNFDKMGMKKDFQHFNGILLAINVETPQQVDVALNKAKLAGALIVTPAKTMSWGGRSGSFKDPEGNTWEITWAEGVPFDSRGAIIF